MKPVEPPTTEGCVRLYHGTTDEAATAIMEKGFRPLQVYALVGGIARQYGLSVADILRAAEGSLVECAYRAGGDDRIYFTTDIMHAAFFAHQGSEAKFEAMQGVYLLRHPDVARYDPAVAEWAQQQTPHVPTVVLVDVPYQEYCRGIPTMPPTVDEWISLTKGLGGSIETRRAPVPMDWLVTALPVERTYDATELAERAGLRWDLIDRLMANGELPPSDGPPPPSAPMWWESSVEPFLKAHG